MTTAITIPAKIQKHQPKPTKAQICEALLERARAAYKKVEDAKTTKREAIQQQINELALVELRKKKPEDFVLNQRTWHGTVEAEILISTPQIKKLMDSLSKYSWASFDEQGTKEKIREKMKTPNPLIGSEEAEKALDTLLKTIMQVESPACIEV